VGNSPYSSESDMLSGGGGGAVRLCPSGGGQGGGRRLSSSSGHLRLERGERASDGWGCQCICGL
jgi:hypothetical protein